MKQFLVLSLDKTDIIGIIQKHYEDLGYDGSSAEVEVLSYGEVIEEYDINAKLVVSIDGAELQGEEEPEILTED